MSDRYIIRTTGQTGPVDTTAQTQLAAHLADTSDAHDASAISFSATGNISSTDVQAAIAELDTDLTAHTGDTSDAHDASAIRVLDTAGNYTATDVEAVLAELSSRYAPLPSGTPTAGQVPVVSTASPLALSWGTAGGLTTGEVATTATGDGTTNDLSAINSDLTALAAAGGGTLVLKRGTYLVGTTSSTGALINLPSNCRIRGVAPEVTIIKSASTQNGHKLISISAKTNASVENLTLDANSTTTSSNGIEVTSASSHCTIRNVTIKAKWGWGVLVTANSTFTTIQDSLLEGSTGSNTIETNGSQYTAILDNRIIGSGNNCIEIYDAVAFRCTGTRVVGNHISGASASIGVGCFGDIGTVIAGNVIRTCGTYGIYGIVSEVNASQPWTGAQITGNTVDGCNTAGGGAGIYVASGVSIGITGNTVINTVGTGNGIGINAGTGSTVTGNTVAYNGGHGIFVNSSASRITIMGNVAMNNSGTAVGARNGVSVDGVNCSIIGNSGSDGRGASNRQQFGVYSGGANNTVIGNRGTGNTNAAVYIGGATNVSLANDNTNTTTALAGYIGFYGATPVAKPTVSGAKGSNAALGSLMTALSTLGLVTDSTSA